MTDQLPELDHLTTPQLDNAEQDTNHYAPWDINPPVPSEPLDFSEMSLAQGLKYLILRPALTSRAFLQIVVDKEALDETPESSESHKMAVSFFETPVWISQFQKLHIVNGIALLRFFWLAFALILMRIAASAMSRAANDPLRNAQGDYGSTLFWVEMSVAVYLLLVAFEERQHILNLFRRRDPNSKPIEEVEPWVGESTADGTGVVYHYNDSVPSQPTSKRSISINELFNASVDWFTRHSLRLILVPAAILLAWYAYDKNTIYGADGRLSLVAFTSDGVRSWLSAIILWYIIFVVDLNGLVRGIFKANLPVKTWIQQWQGGTHWRWTHSLLLIIMLVGAYYRLHDLDGVPPSMTSDHIEKLRDALRIDNGYNAIFFDNNGGRESFQMYFIKFLATTLGFGFSFNTLKLASVIEGMLALPLLYFMTKTLIGRNTKEHDRLGDWVGLAAAGLLAISSWHTMISRLGLRIALTPVAVMLLTICLVRAVRYGRRIDFINMGVVLGVGMYWYQSNRMLPVVASIVVGLAILAGLLRWRQKALPYMVNFAMAGFIAFVIYLPMYHYSQAFPVEFWNRTYGRIYGDNIYGYCDYNPETGERSVCAPTEFEMMQDILKQDDILIANYKDAFRMWGWRGDPAWFQNGKGKPALDPTTNGLFMLGAAMWIIFMIRRRESAFWVVPAGIVIMLLPTTLAITQAATENPSFTRTSGTIPFVFLLAAFPIGTLANELVNAGYTRVVFYVMSIIMLGLVIYSGAQSNWDNYFTTYRDSYAISWKPYDQISEPLKEFAESEGSFGNAFYVHAPHWLDHRIIGAMAGDVDWPNTVDPREKIYQRLRENNNTPYAYDPSKPLLFMINRADQHSLDFFQARFPNGKLRLVPTDYGNDFYVYEVPPGWGWLGTYMTKQIEDLACMTYCGR